MNNNNYLVSRIFFMHIFFYYRTSSAVYMKAPKADPWYTYTTNNFFISWSFDEIFLPLTDCKVKKIFPCCILKALKQIRSENITFWNGIYNMTDSDDSEIDNIYLFWQVNVSVYHIKVSDKIILKFNFKIWQVVTVITSDNWQD